MMETSDLAVGLGYVIGAGAVFLYAPMIYRVVRRRSADGLSPSTWLMKFICYSFNSAYNIYHDYPLSTYSEIIALWVQASLMLFLVCWFQRQWWPLMGAATLTAALTLVASSAVASGDGFDAFLATGQAASSAVGSGAVLPQIALNALRGGSGEFSAITATLLTAGNALRAWTTLTLTHDPILLAGFGAGVRARPCSAQLERSRLMHFPWPQFAVNGVLLGQVLYFGLLRERRSLSQLYSADFVSSAPAAAAASSAAAPERVS